MRGFHGSGSPADPDAYTVDDHLADLAAVRRDVGWDLFVVGGWSMAVQLSLELYARDPDAVSALVLINGPYERALDAAVPIRALADPLVETLRLARGGLAAFNPVARRLGKPWLARARCSRPCSPTS
jgi:pimeloyl-ACP methyl ester carboxylesterase